MAPADVAPACHVCQGTAIRTTKMAWAPPPASLPSVRCAPSATRRVSKQGETAASEWSPAVIFTERPASSRPAELQRQRTGRRTMRSSELSGWCDKNGSWISANISLRYKNDHLPRQARDKLHEESPQKSAVFENRRERHIRSQASRWKSSSWSCHRVRKPPFSRHSYVPKKFNSNICHDRLRTNAGKVEGKRRSLHAQVASSPAYRIAHTLCRQRTRAMRRGSARCSVTASQILSASCHGATSA